MPDRKDDMSVTSLAETETPDAEAAETESPEPEPLPAWIFPPEEGFTADDLDRLRGIPPHAELIDGTLVLVSPQTRFHSLILFLLESALRRTVPAKLRVRREMTVTLGERQRPEPDLIVVHADGDLGSEQTTYQPADVVLAVEVVSAESKLRDRERKPVLYARAGIEHFWRIEEKDGRPTAYVYELDPATKAYALTGIHHDRLKVSVPFDVDIDLTEIDDL
ncbi:Uma2 family endonuclease [Streptosporangium becharense]|uniref:Uma2 family endonuclease n=1 Tax=Streptosporangium becharense TaxID=1816182 RepID=A0A7W9IHC5_9ACTN|nr:Uma2 family endonuclease [Streptosporangium becharense]MBB2908908.1 Uma2 family endonuclease [Streptosporangium becharense]MBB5820074.1 Uma2 family endonuclease [Streptosporangium becharense]